MKRSIFLLFFSVLTVSIFAEEKASTLKVSGRALEGFTGNGLKTANAVLIDPETGDTLYSMTRNAAYVWSGNNEPKFEVTLSCAIPKVASRYLIVGTAAGYDTVYQDLIIDKVGSREYVREIPALVFYPISKRLNEVSVTATKVKFYVKGDTIVYNADAFNVAEGSMLDVLIKQLPGVELKEGGEILVNGRKVESLLLNGDDFFAGNRNLMLNNLGAYTVRNIEVYNKLGERSRLSGRDLGDGQYVMDVKLKKEYMSGWVGNVEGGYGSANRYIGRLFGMWYTSRSRVTIVSNVNNLNDSRTPGQNDSWQSNQTPGDLRTQMMGVNYSFSPDMENDKWKFSGNTIISHTRNNSISSIYTQNFLPGGDTYQTSFGNSLRHNLELTTKNTFDWRPKKMYFSIDQAFSYQKYDEESSSLSGTFQEETSNLTEELLQKVYSGEATSLGDIAINSSLSKLLSNGTTINGGGGLYTSIAIPHTPDIIAMFVDGSFTDNRSDQFNRYGINYNREGVKSEVNQYIKNRPDKNWVLRGGLNYTYVFGLRSSVMFQLGYSHNSSTKDSYLYDLDRLGDAGVFGILPSDYMSVLNPDQSYMSREKRDRYSLNINLTDPGNDNMTGLAYQVYPSIAINRRSLNYVQGPQDETVRRSTIDIEFVNTYLRYAWGNNSMRLLYERNVTPSPLNRMVDITDTRNPLNVYLGASDLKNTATNSLTFSWDKNMQMRKPSRHSWFNTMRFNYILYENALTSGYSLDRETGVRTYKIFNVNGNYRLNWSNTFYHDIGRRNNFSLTSSTRINFAKESDMLASEDMNFRKSAVKNLNLGQSLKLMWRIGKQILYLNGDVTWRRTKGEDTGFSNFSALNFQYGISGQFTLPKGFSLSTDLNVYSRSGYTESYLNRSDVVWNARLSYAVKGGKWLLMLDGFDLLHQLTNVTYNVNAVGRTESYTNVLPRYVLFHVQYKFLIQPKKK